MVARRRNVLIASLILGLLFCPAILLLTGFERLGLRTDVGAVDCVWTGGWRARWELLSAFT